MLFWRTSRRMFSRTKRANRKRNLNERWFPTRKFAGCRWFAHSKMVARRFGSSCEKRLFIAFFRSWHTDDVVWRPFYPWDDWKMEKYGEGRAEESLLSAPGGHRERNYRTGWLARSANSAIFSSGINSSSILMTVLHGLSFGISSCGPRANFSVKLIALIWVKGCWKRTQLKKKDKSLNELNDELNRI